MELIQAPNQCLIGSFAMAMNTTVNTLCELIGHDGMEKISDEPEPWCYRGHHPTEVIEIGEHVDRHIVTVELFPMIQRKDGRIENVPMKDDIGERIRRCRDAGTNAVFAGQTERGTGHAVAWDWVTRQYYDPAGAIRPEGQGPALTLSHVFLCFEAGFDNG